MPAEADDGNDMLSQALAALDRIREVDEPVASSWIAMLTTWASKTSLELVADDVVDRLRVELAGDRRLDAVDQRELGVPLPRLVDESRVLERDAEAAGERDEQALRRSP